MIIKTIKMLVNDFKTGKPLSLRSPRWESVRANHLKNNPLCVACGSKEHLQVHHIKPFHLFPELELDPTNLITLCEFDNKDSNATNDNHHLILGHNGDFHKNNEDVIKEINKYRLTKSNLGELIGYDFNTNKKIISG